VTHRTSPRRQAEHDQSPRRATTPHRPAQPRSVSGKARRALLRVPRGESIACCASIWSLQRPERYARTCGGDERSGRLGPPAPRPSRHDTVASWGRRVCVNPAVRGTADWWPRLLSHHLQPECHPIPSRDMRSSLERGIGRVQSAPDDGVKVGPAPETRTCDVPRQSGPWCVPLFRAGDVPKMAREARDGAELRSALATTNLSSSPSAWWMCRLAKSPGLKRVALEKPWNVGLLPPNEFISLAEEIGLIVPNRRLGASDGLRLGRQMAE